MVLRHLSLPLYEQYRAGELKWQLPEAISDVAIRDCTLAAIQAQSCRTRWAKTGSTWT